MATNKILKAIIFLPVTPKLLHKNLKHIKNMNAEIIKIAIYGCTGYLL